VSRLLIPLLFLLLPFAGCQSTPADRMAFQALNSSWQTIGPEYAGYVETDQRMQTSLRGLFAAGDVRATPFRQLIVAAGEGAIAAHAAAQYIDELKGDAYR
jgi:thioredoxin reductase